MEGHLRQEPAAVPPPILGPRSRPSAGPVAPDRISPAPYHRIPSPTPPSRFSWPPVAARSALQCRRPRRRQRCRRPPPVRIHNLAAALPSVFKRCIFVPAYQGSQETAKTGTRPKSGRSSDRDTCRRGRGGARTGRPMNRTCSAHLADADDLDPGRRGPVPGTCKVARSNGKVSRARRPTTRFASKHDIFLVAERDSIGQTDGIASDCQSAD
jgi:hypothetical protein